MAKIEDLPIKVRLLLVFGLIACIMAGLYSLSVYLKNNEPWPEMTISKICKKNLKQEMAGRVIGIRIYRIYSDDRFEKICDHYFEKEYLKHKKNEDIRIEIELTRLGRAWSKIQENKNE